MKKHWKIIALVLAVLLLCTACEERKVIDISDGGDGIGSVSSAPAAKPAASTATEKPAEEKPAEEKPAEEEPAEEEPADKADTAAPAASGPTGMVELLEMGMSAKAKGMTLVPVNSGAAFVINSVLTETCTITTDPKDYLSASCRVNAAEKIDAVLEFVLLQNDKEIVKKTLSTSLNQGENSIQVLVRLGGAASGEYVGKLFINGELIGTKSVKA